MTTRIISNSDDVIDSRDVIARIEELQAERDNLKDHMDTAEAVGELQSWDDENAEELKALEALAEEAEGCAPEWKHGETLIRDSYFEDYARELAEDIGAISKDQNWPNNCIDWKEAADQLKQYYTAVEFGDATYYIR